MKKSVFVGLSGGVDSSVSAKRLIERGYAVTGVFIKTWHPDFITCTEAADRLDAMRVAAHLNIPFLTFDATQVYERDVAEYMIGEYKKGRTPNPDVMCNRHVKFGAFLKFAQAHGAEYIATGHYAQIQDVQGKKVLARGIDPQKDQSYFLWTLSQEELSHVLFPIGDSLKSDIRQEAEHAQLPVAKKRDSQGVCFLGKIDMESFLSHYIPKELGEVHNENGEVVGTHDGVFFYTIGQRHGFTITHNTELQEPYYVIAKDTEKNVLIVSHTKQTLANRTVVLSNLQTQVSLHNVCEAQFRYRQKPFEIKVIEKGTDTCRIQVHNHLTELPSPGQSAVFYRGAECLGGGIIEEIL